MLKSIQVRAVLLAILGSLVCKTTVSVAAPAEEALAKLNRLAPAERQAALVKEAKNEKTVIWYAPMNREDLRQFTSAFETEYPFLKVEVLDRRPAESAQPDSHRTSRGKIQLRHAEHPQLGPLHAQESRRHWTIRVTLPARLTGRFLRQRWLLQRHLGFSHGLSLQHQTAEPRPGTQIH